MHLLLDSVAFVNFLHHLFTDFSYVVIQSVSGTTSTHVVFNYFHFTASFRRVYVSNIKKHSSAAICGLRNGDRIIEVNGVPIQTLTYETILNKIKLHLHHRDLELLVLDKKSLRWYRDRGYPVSSQTLPTIVQIEPMINNINIEPQESVTQRKINSFIGKNPLVF